MIFHSYVNLPEGTHFYPKSEIHHLKSENSRCFEALRADFFAVSSAPSPLHQDGKLNGNSGPRRSCRFLANSSREASRESLPGQLPMVCCCFLTSMDKLPSKIWMVASWGVSFFYQSFGSVKLQDSCPLGVKNDPKWGT